MKLAEARPTRRRQQEGDDRDNGDDRDDRDNGDDRDDGDDTHPLSSARSMFDFKTQSGDDYTGEIGNQAFRLRVSLIIGYICLPAFPG